MKKLITVKKLFARIAKLVKAGVCKASIVGSNPTLCSNIPHIKYVDINDIRDCLKFKDLTFEKNIALSKKSKEIFNNAIKETNKYIDYLNSLN